jgi:MoxR-like ATPase
MGDIMSDIIVNTGIAATSALKENFYSIILASMNGMPVLITGPPGCGK